MEDPVLGQEGGFGTLLFRQLAWQCLGTLCPGCKDWHWVDGVLPTLSCKATEQGPSEKGFQAALLGSSAEELQDQVQMTMGTIGNDFPLS